MAKTDIAQVARRVTSPEKMRGVLYRLTFPNGKAYIGITSGTLARRLALHRCQAKKEERGALQRAIRKYGEAGFTAEILAVGGDFGYLQELERRAIRAYGTFTPNGYNLTLGGEGNVGYTPSPEAIAKCKATKQRIGYVSAGRPGGWKHTEEAKEKISASGMGRIFSPERRARIGASKVGNKFNVGREVSEETRRKIILAHAERSLSPQHLEALRAAMRKQAAQNEDDSS